MPDGSSSSGSRKWSYHFGLYRQTALHAKEDFLKLSRAKQIRRGWTCAAVSSLAVISAIVIILIIYDYAIVVESSLVHKRGTKYAEQNLSNDFQLHGGHFNGSWRASEKLNRRSLDFNFETLQKLPHLVNALEETNMTIVVPSGDNDFYHNNSALDPSELNINETAQPLARRWTPMRRTSPRPFYYESKESTPAPFHKQPAITHPSWLENYRNMQRLKNIEKIIDYLKMNHARTKDNHGVGSNTYIAFSGVYGDHRKRENENMVKPMNASTNNSYSRNSNDMVNGHAYQSDILRTYKPDNPAEINLLAENKIKITSHIKNTYHKPPFKRPILADIRYPFYDCRGENCFPNDEMKANFHSEEKETLKTASTTVSNHQDRINDKTRLLSLMLDIYPMEEKSEELLKLPTSIVEAMTSTKAPFAHFRPRPNIHNNHFSSNNNRFVKTTPLVLRPSPSFYYNSIKTQTPNYFYLNRKRLLPNKERDETIKNKPTQMLVHLNLYPKKKIVSDDIKPDGNLGSILKPSLSEITTTEPAANVEIIKSTSFKIPINESTIPPFKTVPQDVHFPTVLENARRINELQLLKPEYIPFGFDDAKKPDELFGLRATLNTQPASSSNDHIQVKEFSENKNCSNKNDIKDQGQSEVESFKSANSTQSNNGHYRNINTHSSKDMFATNDDKHARRVENYKTIMKPLSKLYHTINRKSTISLESVH